MEPRTRTRLALASVPLVLALLGRWEESGTRSLPGPGPGGLRPPVGSSPGSPPLAPSGSTQAPPGAPPVVLRSLPPLDPDSPEFPLVDLSWRARPWVSQAAGRPWGGGPPLALDPRGWVRRLEPGQSADAPVFWDRTPVQELSLTLLHQGRGTLAFPLGGRVLERAPGRLRLLLPAGRKFVVRLVGTQPGDHLREIQLLPEGLAPGPFRPSFLESLSGVDRVAVRAWLPAPEPPPEWASRSRPGDYPDLARGLPAELLLELAERASVDLVLPPAGELPGSFLDALGDFLEAGLPPGRRVHRSPPGE